MRGRSCKAERHGAVVRRSGSEGQPVAVGKRDRAIDEARGREGLTACCPLRPGPTSSRALTLGGTWRTGGCRHRVTVSVHDVHGLRAHGRVYINRAWARFAEGNPP